MSRWRHRDGTSRIQCPFNGKTHLHCGEDVVFIHERRAAPEDAVYEARNQVALAHTEVRCVEERRWNIRLAASPELRWSEPVLKGTFRPVDQNPVEVGMDAGEICGDLAGQT